MGNRASQTQKQGALESQPLANTSARFIHASTYVIGEIMLKEPSTYNGQIGVLLLSQNCCFVHRIRKSRCGLPWWCSG